MWHGLRGAQPREAPLLLAQSRRLTPGKNSPSGRRRQSTTLRWVTCNGLHPPVVLNCLLLGRRGRHCHMVGSVGREVDDCS